MSFLSGPSLPQHCEPSSDFLVWISSTFHTCIPSALGLISSILGCLSIVSWLFAQLPQIYKNYKLQSTAGLSAFFLVEWCLGDTTNLVGAVFTRQASWQVAVASYYVFVDVVLVFQYFWYTYVTNTSKGKDSISFRDDAFDGNVGPILEGVRIDAPSAPEPTKAAAHLMPASEPKDMSLPKKHGFDTPEFYSPSYSEKSNNAPAHREARPSSSLPLGISPKTIMLTSMLCAVFANASPTDKATIRESSHELDIETAGRILSWMSTILYLGSRLPQLYKNYIRQSTAGLSPLLFMAAFGGNFFYSASLLTNPNAWNDYPAYGGGGWADGDGNNRLEWITLALPFFLGAAGVLSLDAFVGVQFLIYGDNAGYPITVVSDGDDQSLSSRRRNWRRVSGWMRGWIPSTEFNKFLSPSSLSSSNLRSNETQALLANSSDSTQPGYGSV